LNVSKDPIRGNDKKHDTFWKEITEEFNRKGDRKRRREVNQLKVHWSRLKSSITDFNDAWSQIAKVHTSGYSDDMLEEEAQKVYEIRFGKRFQLVHWWKILKEEPKWCALFEEKEKDKNEIHDVPEEQQGLLVEKQQRLSTVESARRITLWKDLSSLVIILKKFSRFSKIERRSAKRLQKPRLRYQTQI
jgi:hypothetical protein